MNKDKNVALVLSGGAARGLAERLIEIARETTAKALNQFKKTKTLQIIEKLQGLCFYI